MAKLNKSFFIRKTLVSIIISFLLAGIGCVTTVGPSISIKEIPLEKEDNFTYLNGIKLALGSIKDARTLDYTTTGHGLVTPGGDVSTIVELAFREHLSAAGANLEFDAPVVVKGEIREWQSSYHGSSTGALDSVASIHLEVISQPSGTKVFSGTFKGNRASHFPIVTPADMRDSLGFAMSQAMQQAIKDGGFQRALR